VREKRFREDLYYRLNVIEIRTPPLRDRPGEIIPLAEYFIERSGDAHHRAALKLSDDARAALSGYALERASDPAFTQNLTTWNLGGSTSYLDTTARAGATYYYRVSAVSANGTSVPSGAAQTAALASPGSSKLSNISTRGFVGTGSSGLIAGFVVDGSSPKMVLVRASGPAIAAAPFNVPGTLPDPLLQVYSGSAVIASNRGWGGNAPVAAAAAEVGAFAWSDPSSNDAALLMTLSPGAYTAIVSGAGGDTGVSLVEVYDVE